MTHPTRSWSQLYIRVPGIRTQSAPAPWQASPRWQTQISSPSDGKASIAVMVVESDFLGRHGSHVLRIRSNW